VLAVNVVPAAPEVGETDTLPPLGATNVKLHIAYRVTSDVNVILFPGEYVVPISVGEVFQKANVYPDRVGVDVVIVIVAPDPVSVPVCAAGAPVPPFALNESVLVNDGMVIEKYPYAVLDPAAFVAVTATLKSKYEFGFVPVELKVEPVPSCT
jgi:hypothetical protein